MSAGNLVVRKMALTDDLRAVAGCIYDTDPYIFPYLYDGNEELGKDVVINMIKGDTLYNYRNVTVAELDGKIVGIIVALRAPFKVSMPEMVNAFINAGAVVDGRFSKVFNEYYKLMEDEPDGIYIANVCVAKEYRSRGIAKKMLQAFLSPDETYNLETVKANESAFRLYTGLGFELECEYLGFTDVPCYRMKKTAKKHEGR